MPTKITGQIYTWITSLMVLDCIYSIPATAKTGNITLGYITDGHVNNIQ